MSPKEGKAILNVAVCVCVLLFVNTFADSVFRLMSGLHKTGQLIFCNVSVCRTEKGNVLLQYVRQHSRQLFVQQFYSKNAQKALKINLDSKTADTHKQALLKALKQFVLKKYGILIKS